MLQFGKLSVSSSINQKESSAQERALGKLIDSNENELLEEIRKLPGNNICADCGASSII